MTGQEGPTENVTFEQRPEGGEGWYPAYLGEE